MPYPCTGDVPGIFETLSNLSDLAVIKKIISAVFLLVLVFCLCGQSMAAPASKDVFGCTEIEGEDLPLHGQFNQLWQRVLAAERQNPSFTPGGENFPPADAKSWGNLVKLANRSVTIEKIRLVNGFFNQWRPVSDEAAFATPEYWATPKEFKANRGGDCEDYAIAKYFALRFLGLDAEPMRIVIVKDNTRSSKAKLELHAVLAVKANGSWFILDNNARPLNNLPLDYMYNGRYSPLYSVNESGAWGYEETAGIKLR